MGQEETIKMVMELKFTTLKELIPLLEKDMGRQSIINALSKLVKNNEIMSIRIAKEQLYIDKKFYNKIWQ